MRLNGQSVIRAKNRKSCNPGARPVSQLLKPVGFHNVVDRLLLEVKDDSLGPQFLDTRSNHQVPQLTRQPVKKLTNRFIVRIYHSHDCPTTLMLQPSSDEGHNTETLECLLTLQEMRLVNFYLIFCVSAAC